MIYKTYYNSPIGRLMFASKNNELIGLWIDGQKHYLRDFDEDILLKDDEEILVKTKNWLERYFNRR